MAFSCLKILATLVTNLQVVDFFFFPPFHQVRHEYMVLYGCSIHSSIPINIQNIHWQNATRSGVWLPQYAPTMAAQAC